MKITIIVPFYNAKETLEACLESLKAQTSADYEVLAIDNGSTDDSFEIAQRFSKKMPNLQVFQEFKKGAQCARNLGIKQASGEIIAFTDSDCIVSQNWVSEIQTAFQQHSEVAAIAGQIKGAPPVNIIQKFLCLYTLRSSCQEEKMFNQFDLFEGGFPTANFAVRMEILKKIGSFYNLPYMAEDIDLCVRIYALGEKILYTPKVLIWHQHRTKLAEMLKQSYRCGGAQATLLAYYFKNDWIVELPGKILRGKGTPFPVWINLTYFDKKMLGGLLLTGIWPPLFLILFFYLLYLFYKIRKEGEEADVLFSILEKCQCLGLLFLKSLAMTGGRLIGGIQNKGVCL